MRKIWITLTALAWATGCAAQTKVTPMQFEEIAAKHPASETLNRLFTGKAAAVPAEFEPSGLTKKDYLTLIEGNVDFFKKYQTEAGAIHDPYDKDEGNNKGREKQYSTPAFALAAAIMIQEKGRDDLREPAVRAFDFALTALQNGTTANQHADFYIPMLVHAHRILKSRVPEETRAKWEMQFQSLIPEKAYRDTGGGGNWNIVNVAGEALRRKDKLVAPDQLDAQQSYLDSRLERQQRNFTKFGMYDDANQPLAYDAFPRLWLEDMIADGAYDGPRREAVEEFLTLGAFSSLLLFSPQGEWACGGRSAHHQWNEAELAVIAEINAAKWKARGRDDIAGSFKRMARLGLKSMQRWQRPSGELWIVKNFAEPTSRFGFEGYSYHSQYNLLPMAMLAIAYVRADESIKERPLPAEFSTYIFDLREKFHKVVAASDGYYVLIDTGADPHYDATGLVRMHRRGLELSPLSDSAAGERVFWPLEGPKAALTPGLQWKEAIGFWMGLADYHRYEHPPEPKSAPAGMIQPAPAPQHVVTKVDLTVSSPSRFTLRYELNTVTPKLIWPKGATEEELYTVDPQAVRIVNQAYDITPDGVICSQDVRAPQPQRWTFPALVSDGTNETNVTLAEGEITIARKGGELKLHMMTPNGMTFERTGEKVATHNGFMQAVSAPLLPPADSVMWKLQLK